MSLILLVLTISLVSCRNSEELMYLKNASNRELVKALNDSAIEYIVKPGDILYVSIKSMNAEVNALFNPESNMEQQSYNSYQKYTSPQGAYLYGFEVNEKGMLTLPVLGDIPVTGRPQSQVELVVQERANQYLKEAIVRVKLLNYKVTVLGEVKSPGVYYNYNNNFTLFEALAMANGSTDYANIKRVMVVRPQAEGNQTTILDLSDKDVWMSKAFYLHPNDYIFVEPDKNKNFQLNSQAYSLFFSSLSVLLAVLGFVLK
ncbi:polysaccharide biosynthesis/export family protein [Gaoshiqia sp. Z1-71]|uniref:polysaccharide biosynthesis/export family protein n=1 Tax=Gaoshiqia hydrogeniformans TaxID=3290090 RepID=UPI003BF7A575